MEAYVELINHKFVISELAVELSSVLKRIKLFCSIIFATASKWA
jgi:hypothetical protein